MNFVRVKQLVGFGDYAEDSSLPHSLIAAASVNPTLVKDSQGIITGLIVINVSAAVKYLKLYDQNVAPVGGQAAAPVRRIPIPASTTGAGVAVPIITPWKFRRGIAYTITGGQADSDATALAAGDVVLSMEYV